MVWLVGMIYGIVVVVWTTAGWEDCAVRIPIAEATSPMPWATEVKCVWADEAPELGKPLRVWWVPV